MMQSRTYVLGAVCLTARHFFFPFINNELSSSQKQRNQARKYLISERRKLCAADKIGAVWNSKCNWKKKPFSSLPSVLKCLHVKAEAWLNFNGSHKRSDSHKTKSPVLFRRWCNLSSYKFSHFLHSCPFSTAPPLIARSISSIGILHPSFPWS